jgi:hypothetical protein
MSESFKSNSKINATIKIIGWRRWSKPLTTICDPESGRIVVPSEPGQKISKTHLNK